MRVGSLFSGIGGFDVAAECMGWSTRWFCEIDPFCRDALAHHWPGVPIHGDITTLDFSEVEPVDLLCAGFPCQPASHAGSRKGTDDQRWLWPHIARAVRVLRPRYLVLENVPGLASVNDGRAMGAVLGDVAALGYDARWDHLSAGELGAPHKRDRLWIVAYPAGLTRQDAGRSGDRRRVFQDGGGCGELGHADRGRREQRDAIERDGLELGARLVSMGDADGLGESHAPAVIRWRRAEQEPCESGGNMRDAARGGWRAGGGVKVRRADGGRDGVGDASGAGHEEWDAAAESRHSPHAPGERRCVGGWEDAVRVTGADGTVRLIPREAAEEGPESPLWPLADGVPGRVARLRAVGNAVSPQWVIEGPFAEVERVSRWAVSEASAT